MTTGGREEEERDGDRHDKTKRRNDSRRWAQEAKTDDHKCSHRSVSDSLFGFSILLPCLIALHILIIRINHT